MMNKEILTIIITAGVTLGITGSIKFGFSYLKSKGVNSKKILDEAETGLKEIKTTIKAAEEIAPDIPELKILDTVEEWAQIGVDKAQQLYISSQLSADQRNQVAKDTVINTLNELNIPITDNLKFIINAAIESKVFNLKTDTEKSTAAQNTNTKTINKLAADKASLQQQVNNLTNKINTIQATVTPQAQN